MKKVLLIILLIPIQFGFITMELSKSAKKKINKEIEAIYNVGDYSLDVLNIPGSLITELKTPFNVNKLYKIIAEDNLMGYAFIGRAPSKTDEFDFLVLFDTDLIITKALVLAYREDYGGEIGSRRWLKQFIGLNETKTVDYGNNIVPISGATISARAMTIAINDLLQSLVILKKHKII